jgi:hypothetical protein
MRPMTTGEGFTVEVLGRAGLRYREGWRTMDIDGEMLLGPRAFVVYARSIKRWRFPFGWRAVSPAERDRIVANIRRAFRAAGAEIEVDL